MPRLQRKSFTTPDQVRQFPTGRIHIVTLDEMAIGRFVFQPGWRWSKDVAPIVGTHSCQLRHIGYTNSGTLEVRMDDGTKLVINPGDAYEIPPGHDAWVIGDEPWDAVEFASAHAYGLSPEQLGERVLVTILFSDIVASTEMIGRLGDKAWAALLREHNMKIRAALFDSASLAVNAAMLMDPAVAELGIRVRVGIHTGEVEISGGKARGLAVHAAARIAALAGPGEVLLSGTTHDMFDGSARTFESRGNHELKGLSGARPIFALKR
jgi:class 3 adenylate cyclase/quercetin dioxygenase-like cupin family protein